MEIESVQIDHGQEETQRDGLAVVVENPLAIFGDFCNIDRKDIVFAHIQNDKLSDPVISSLITFIQYDGPRSVRPADSTFRNDYRFTSIIQRDTLAARRSNGYIAPEQVDSLALSLGDSGCTGMAVAVDEYGRSITFTRDERPYRLDLGYANEEEKTASIKKRIDRERIALYRDPKNSEYLEELLESKKNTDTFLSSLEDTPPILVEEGELVRDFEEDLERYAGAYEAVLKGIYKIHDTPEPDRTFKLRAERPVSPQLRRI